MRESTQQISGIEEFLRIACAIPFVEPGQWQQPPHQARIQADGGHSRNALPVSVAQACSPENSGTCSPPCPHPPGNGVLPEFLPGRPC